MGFLENLVPFPRHRGRTTTLSHGEFPLQGICCIPEKLCNLEVVSLCTHGSFLAGDGRGGSEVGRKFPGFYGYLALRAKLYMFTITNVGSHRKMARLYIQGLILTLRALSFMRSYDNEGFSRTQWFPGDWAREDRLKGFSGNGTRKDLLTEFLLPCLPCLPSAVFHVAADRLLNRQARKLCSPEGPPTPCK
jgi:hypothetical protein